MNQANRLHRGLAACSAKPHKFCNACLDNRPVFLDQADLDAYHQICRNYIAYRHCDPGFDDPTLPGDIRRLHCTEMTVGQMDDARAKEDEEDEEERASDRPMAPEPPDPSPEEQIRLKAELVKAMQKLDAEEAAKARASGPAPAAH